MKPALKACLLAAGLFFIAASSPAFAVQPGCNDDGPGGGLWDTMKNAADTRRIRDSGMNRVVTRPPNSTLMTTCFDSALALTVRLGSIFSDVPPLNIQPPDVNTFSTAIYNSYAGLGAKVDPVTGQSVSNTMLDSLGNTFGNATSGVTGTLDGYLSGNFADSFLAVNFGSTVTDSLDTFTNTLTLFNGSISLNGVLDLNLNIGDATSFLNTNLAPSEMNVDMSMLSLDAGVTDAITGYTEALQTISTIAGVVSSISDMVGQAAAMNAQIQPLAQSLYSGVVDIWGNPAAALMASAQTSMSGLDWLNVAATLPAGYEPGCSAVSDIWGRFDFATSTFTPGIKGGGAPDVATLPFLTADDIVASSFLLNNGYAIMGGQNLVSQISSAPNQTIINNFALDVEMRLGGPNNPGTPDGLKSWPQSPSLPHNISTNNLVILMEAAATPP